MQTLTLIAALLLCGSAQAAVLENSAPAPRDIVSDVFPFGMDYLHDRIALEFDSSARAYYEDYNSAIYDLPGHAASLSALSDTQRARFTSFPLVRSNKFYVFYGAYPNMQRTLDDITPQYAVGQDNIALEQYAELPAKARGYDLYLWSPDTPFWYSEYSLRGKPLPFRSYFIIHMAPVDTEHTSVEVIEDQPVIQAGRRTTVDAHGTLHPYDIRPVAPTTTEREFLLSCMHQFLDRGVPGRHWFNCKTAEELAQPEPEPIRFSDP